MNLDIFIASTLDALFRRTADLIDKAAADPTALTTDDRDQLAVFASNLRTSANPQQLVGGMYELPSIHEVLGQPQEDVPTDEGEDIT